MLQVPVDFRVGSEPDPVPGGHGHKVLVESLLKSLPISGRDVDSVMILRNPGSHARLSIKEAMLGSFWKITNTTYVDRVLPENIAIHDKKIYINCDKNIRVINLSIIAGKHPVQLSL